MIKIAGMWLKRRAAGIVATSLLVLVGLWLMAEQQSAAMVEKPKELGLTVTVVETIPADAQLEVNTTGITQPRWATEVIASVSGRVIHIANNAMPGSLIRKGEILASLQDTFYQSELSAAQARVSEAELNLAEMLTRQYVAKRGDKAKSSFGRLEPHVKAAEAHREAARGALASSQQRLADTQIKAPFDSVVIADLIHPGQWINEGDVLFRVAASDYLDIKVELSEQAWQRLNSLQQGPYKITIEAPDGQQWQASVRYLSPIMDAVTRQRSLMLQVADPFQRETPLLADQQVDVVFGGNSQSYVVSAPASVLTEDGKVWSVSEQSLLLEEIELLDMRPDSVLFRYKNRPHQNRQLVRFPLTNFVEGQAVAMTIN